MLDSVFVTFRANGLKVKQSGLMRLVVLLIPCMVLLTSVFPYTLVASPDPGWETDNVPPSIEISREVIPPRPGGLTVTCPDGTVNDVVRECETALNTGCPPNKVVIFTQAGECVVVGVPVTCPDRTLAPNEADCNIPPISTIPLQPLPTQQQQLQMAPPPLATTPETPPGPGEQSAYCAAVGCRPGDPSPPEPVAAQQPEQDQQGNNEDEDSLENLNENPSSKDEGDNSGDGGNDNDNGGDDSQ